MELLVWPLIKVYYITTQWTESSGVSTAGPIRAWALPSMPSALPIIADFSQTEHLAFGRSLKADRYTLIEQSNILLKQSDHNVDIVTLATI